MGHTVVIASSATRMQIAPVARDLGIAHIVCTELEEKDGRLVPVGTGYERHRGAGRIRPPADLLE